MLGTVAVIPMLIALGQWQLTRAAEKQRSHEQYLQRSAAPAMRLDPREAEVWKLPEMRYRHMEVRGRYAVGQQLLLDNQVYEGAAGYLVYTPFLLDEHGIYMLINRGWVAAGPDRREPPVLETPAEVMTLSGVAMLSPPPGIKMGENVPEHFGPGMVRLQRMDMDQIALEYAGKLLPYELRLDASMESGFARAWSAPGSGHERHLGYAFQWFASAVVVVILYIFLNLHREAARK